MNVFFDFKCKNGHVFEDFVDRSVTTSRCKCGADAVKILTVPNFHLEGASGDYPTAAQKWERDHVRNGSKGPNS